jgi:hypothetical protein
MKRIGPLYRGAAFRLEKSCNGYYNNRKDTVFIVKQ